MAHVHPGLYRDCLEVAWRVTLSPLSAGCLQAALSLPCAGKYVFRGLQSTRSTYSTEHLEYEAPELQTINPTHGQRAETILVLIQLLTEAGTPTLGTPRATPGGGRGV